VNYLKCFLARSKLFAIAICILILLGIGTGYESIEFYIYRVEYKKQLKMDFDPTMLKERAQIEIKPCNDIPKVTEQEAIEIAIKNGGPGDRAQVIHAQYVLLTDSFHDSIPVWIVSFRGINGNENITRHGTPVTENNFVIDVRGGNVLYCFSFR
jgi:hypothetical protein